MADKYLVYDIPKIRENIFELSKKAVASHFPIGDNDFELRLDSIDYLPTDVDYKTEKKAILLGTSLIKPLRGRITLYDKKTNKPISSMEKRLLGVPYLTDRGTFIINGVEYGFGNQLRLRPGIYTRLTADGEYEAQVNSEGRTGHRYLFNPEEGVFYVRIGQASIPLISVLFELGVKPEEIEKYWGKEVYLKNASKQTPNAIKRMEAAFSAGGAKLDIKKEFNNILFDPEVNRITLGVPADRLTPEIILLTTQKLLKASRGEGTLDSRGHIAFLRNLGPEEFLVESIKKTGNLLKKYYNNVRAKRDVNYLPAWLFDASINQAFFKSGIAQALQEINPLEILDNRFKNTRTGKGGIENSRSISEDIRQLHSSHLGFIDPIVTPEGENVGVDNRFTIATKKDAKGNVYSEFYDVRQKKNVYLSPRDLFNKVIAFSEEDLTKSNVPAIVNNQHVLVRPSDVDYVIPTTDHFYTLLTNLIPLKQNSYNQRISMGARMLTQAVPLIEPESPLVRNLSAIYGKSYDVVLGDKLLKRSPVSGTVTRVDSSNIYIKADNGEIHRIPYYNNFPFNNKTFIDDFPIVKAGDKVKKGQPITTNNYTDKDGVLALGKNLKTAYLAFDGYNFEDAAVLSESAAKKLSSDQLYQEWVDVEKDHFLDKKRFISVFPTKFSSKEDFDKYSDEGVIKVGQVVKKGDPLILLGKKTTSGTTMKRVITDASIVWDHDSPGIVVDVATSPKHVNVVVRSVQQMKVGDKLCYSEDTEVLTNSGWKRIDKLGTEDQIATLNPVSFEVEYLYPYKIYTYEHDGEMYLVENEITDLCVTMEHNLFVRTTNDDASSWKFLMAKEAVGKDVYFKNTSSGCFSFAFSSPLIGGEIPQDFLCILLGLFFNFGKAFINHNNTDSFLYFAFPEKYSTFREHLLDLLNKNNFSFEVEGRNIRITDNKILSLFDNLHTTYRSLLSFSPSSLALYLKYLFSVSSRVACSASLADTLQQLALHAGSNAVIIKKEEENTFVELAAELPTNKNARVIDYSGKVYCVSLPRNHVLFVRRNGKPIWSGNSGRYGDKHIVSLILPDEQMPKDENGEPFELLLNPLGVQRRVNLSQLWELLLSKVAKKTGQPIEIEDHKYNMVEFLSNLLAQHNIKDKEKVFIDKYNTTVEAPTGYRYVLKLHHLAESKLGERGLGAYSSEEVPTKGGKEGAKRIGLLEMLGLLSHGAYDAAMDARVVRGQKNEEYWTRVSLGYDSPKNVGVPFVYDKFMKQLTAAGLYPEERGDRINFYALTNSEIKKLSRGRQFENGEGIRIVGDELSPVKGGLFDPDIVGGLNGNFWAEIPLPDKFPNPLVESSLRTLLDLSEKDFTSVLSGEKEYKDFGTGSAAIIEALKSINVPKKIKEIEEAIPRLSGQALDKEIKKVKFLKALQKYKIPFEELFWDSVPVLPPVFRPAGMLSTVPIVSDINFLYKDLFDTVSDYNKLKEYGLNEPADKKAIYAAIKAVVGLVEPIHPKLRAQKMKGIIPTVIGATPKEGVVQKKLLGATVNLVGRATIIPNPNLGLDEVAIPEEAAWEIYSPYIVRELVRAGRERIRAVDEVTKRTPEAKEALLKVMNERPVIISRAPVLHKYGILAAWPKLSTKNVMEIHPFTVTGFGADFDGDAMQFHVPADPRAVDEAIEKLLPSKNLISFRQFRAQVVPSLEYLAGLYYLSKLKGKGEPKVFKNSKEVLKALLERKISPDQNVVVEEEGRK